ncbi:hypothetical protein BJX70DRAFT_41710 [Aspergillus crustosus]
MQSRSQLLALLLKSFQIVVIWRIILYPPPYHTRIVSICCKSSMSPLGITETAMQVLIDKYKLDISFTDLLLSFGNKPRTADAGHGGMTVMEKVDESFDIQYRITYPESYKVFGSHKFTSRQVAVFHRYCPSGTGSLWVFLHARPDTELQSRLEKVLSGSSGDEIADWFSLHLLVFSSYLRNWSWRLRNIGEDIEKP